MSSQDIVNTVLSAISCMLQPASQLLGNMANLEENAKKLTDAAEILNDTEENIHQRVDYAHSQGLQLRVDVQNWLKKASQLKVEVEAFNQELFQQRLTCLGGFCPNCRRSCKMGRKAEETLGSVQNLIQQGEKLKTVADPVHNDIVGMMPPDKVVVHNDAYRKMQRIIRDDNVGIVGIHGSNGVGKTCLLRRIWNDFDGIHAYNIVIWVSIPEAVNLIKIQNEIAAKLLLPSLEDHLKEQEAIFKALVANRFALFLDDLTNSIDLSKIGVPIPNEHNQSKVIFTTESEAACEEMDAWKIEIAALEPKEAWDFFRHNVGEKALNSHPGIPGLAGAIAKECRGLPLAIAVIGHPMASRQKVEEWDEALAMLRGLPPPVSSNPGMAKHLLTLLKFGYDHLPNDIIRQCFLYCSLFPEHHCISIKQLVGYWIGEGLLGSQVSTMDEALMVGCEAITHLKDVALLQRGENEEEVVMQVVIRKMGQWIASDFGKKKNKMMVEGSMNLNKAPEEERWREAERISLVGSEIDQLSGDPYCPILVSLLLQGNKKLSHISADFFHFTHVLRVLDLSDTGLTDLPASIGRLLELRYLNLSNTKLTTLPIEIKYLRKLLYLALRRTLIRTASAGLFPHLSDLLVLDMHCAGCFLNEKEPNTLYIEELECLKSLNDLGISILYYSTLKMLAESHRLVGLIAYLYMESCNDLNILEISSNTFGAMARLKDLWITKCDLLEVVRVSDNYEGPKYSSLEKLQITRNYRLNRIELPKRWISSIRSLELSFCMVKSVTWIKHLQSIENLEIHSIEVMEEVITKNEEAQEGPISLPKLRSLKLYSLPKLSYICSDGASFPSLKTLHLSNCRRLKMIPKGMLNEKTIRQIIGGKRWWEKMEG